MQTAGWEWFLPSFNCQTLHRTFFLSAYKHKLQLCSSSQADCQTLLNLLAIVNGGNRGCRRREDESVGSRNVGLF